jgi:methylmalonyl-CoA mutase cobalamin-binding subunit
MPAEEIIYAANQTSARAVALSIIHPCNDPLIPDELATVREHLATSVPILVGGRGVASYQDALKNAGIKWLRSLSELRAALTALRSLPPEA